ncbi:MAG TPA: hypothetical protein P5569_05630 [Candidatus Latescibacteria bacterium]|nr:hypothetical protein [Candidatus Latescibacterota bacterium]
MTRNPAARIWVRTMLAFLLFGLARATSAEQGLPGDSGCTYHSVTFSLIPRVSTTYGHSKPVTNLSINLLVGKHFALRGVEIGGITNVQESYARGLQVAGIVNVAGGNVRGIQSAGIVNVAGQTVRGIQGAGIVNIAGKNLIGTQASLIGCISGNDVRGSQTAGIFAIAGRSVEGFQGSYVIGISGAGTIGAQTSGIMSISGGGVEGVQFAGIGSIAGGTVEGIQAASIFAVAPQVRGAQFGMFTAADSVFGLQVGFVNRSKRPEGYPLGLINCVEGVPVKVGFVVDESAGSYVELTTGSLHTHGIVALGGRIFATPETQAVGLGVGLHFQKTRHYWDIDAITYGNFAADSGGEGAVSALRFILGIPVNRHLDLFAGGRMSLFVSDTGTGAALAPWSLYKGTVRGRYVRVWPGLTGGVRVSL